MSYMASIVCYGHLESEERFELKTCHIIDLPLFLDWSDAYSELLWLSVDYL